MRITRSLTIPALALALLAGGSTAAAINSGGTPVTPPVTERVATTTCEESDPCWDCETMGNQICGLPDIQANEAKRATAWAAWDNQAGWTQLRVDPSREVRVDVIGYSPSPVRGELSLHGADGLWYVFDAR